jgi:histidinol-phosphate aminotransferase
MNAPPSHKPKSDKALGKRTPFGLTPRPGILEIEAYVGGKSKIAGRDTVIKLSSNESALGPSPRALEAYRKAAADMHRYPDGGSVALREAIGARFGLDSDRIVCGAGSDELLGLLGRAYAGPGDEVLYSEHGFLIYPIVAHSVGAMPVKAGETRLTTDVDKLLAKVTPNTRLLYIANPNNPTGSYIPAAALARLRRELPAGVLLVIDAAYAEFVTANDYEAGTALVDASVDAGDNVVMTRTFSKIFAMGGMRLGWAYCPPRVADLLNRLRMPFNVSAAAQAAGIAALEDVAFTSEARDHNERWRNWLTAELQTLGYRVHPSAANFVLVQFAGGARGAEAADKFLTARGIIARQVAKYGLPDCLRITVGLESEMRAVAAALADFMIQG